MYQITDVIVVAVAAAGITLVLASWFYERELKIAYDEIDYLESRIPTGPDPEEKTPGIPDEYLRPLAYAGLFTGNTSLGVDFPWTPEKGDQG